MFEHYFVIVRGSCYFYGGGSGRRAHTAALLAAIEEARRGGATLYSRTQIETLVRGEKIITLSNVGDLIFD